MYDFQAIAVAQNRFLPLRPGNNLAVQFDCQAFGFHAQLLDQRGQSLDSPALAALLREWRAEDRTAVCFVIGGADGLAPSLAAQAKLRLAFGASTWPHALVRIMLLEQLYRAGTILAGHPYHRS